MLGDPTKTSLPSSTQQNALSPEHLIRMPLSFANTSTACTQSKCQTSRPKCFLLQAVKSGFGHIAQILPARGGFWFSMSSGPLKFAELLHYALFGVMGTFCLARTSSIICRSLPYPSDWARLAAPVVLSGDLPRLTKYPRRIFAAATMTQRARAAAKFAIQVPQSRGQHSLKSCM